MFLGNRRVWELGLEIACSLWEKEAKRSTTPSGCGRAWGCGCWASCGLAGGGAGAGAGAGAGLVLGCWLALAGRARSPGECGLVPAAPRPPSTAGAGSVFYSQTAWASPTSSPLLLAFPPPSLSLSLSYSSLLALSHGRSIEFWI
jgi:hypothetical protein